MSTFRWQAWWLVVLLGAGLADCKCRSTPVTVPPGLGQVDDHLRSPNPAGAKRMTLQPEWTACTGDGQCVHTAADCCGCSGGGADVSLNARSMGELAKVRDQECNQSLCAAVMGTDVSCYSDAKCIDGQCRLQTRQSPPPPSTEGVGVEPIKPPIGTPAKKDNVAKPVNIKKELGAQ